MSKLAEVTLTLSTETELDDDQYEEIVDVVEAWVDSLTGEKTIVVGGLVLTVSAKS